MRKTFACAGPELAPSTTPEQLGSFVKAEVTKWRGVVQKSGAQLDWSKPRRGGHAGAPAVTLARQGYERWPVRL
ncbi:hypothetical protein ACU4GD_24895 [Cupriavidus basilensis]